jgi:hypothetical protein
MQSVAKCVTVLLATYMQLTCAYNLLFECVFECVFERTADLQGLICEQIASKRVEHL